MKYFLFPPGILCSFRWYFLSSCLLKCWACKWCPVTWLPLFALGNSWIWKKLAACWGGCVMAVLATWDGLKKQEMVLLVFFLLVRQFKGWENCEMVEWGKISAASCWLQQVKTAFIQQFLSLCKSKGRLGCSAESGVILSPCWLLCWMAKYSFHVAVGTGGGAAEWGWVKTGQME